MKQRYAQLLVLLLILPAFCKADPIDKITDLIKQGNAHELAQFFASNVDISILDNANLYSKTQAEIIVEKFFKENKAHSVKLLHRINSNPKYNFAVLILNTDKGTYRVAFTLKDAAGTMAIVELRIETEKT